MFPLLTPELKELLKFPEQGRLVIVTVGNDLRGDDGAGPYLAENLQLKSAQVVLINAGEKPENYTDDIINLKPAKIVIIDAANFGGRPGELRQLAAEQLDQKIMSTHRFPLAALARIIETDTGSPVYFLGIQLQNVTLGSPMTEPIRNAAAEIINYLKEQDHA